MENTGVSCNVSECVYNRANNKCEYPRIEVTHDYKSGNSEETPHFCKSFEER